MERERAVELIQAELKKQRRMAELLNMLAGQEMMAEHRSGVANALEIALEALGAKGDAAP